MPAPQAVAKVLLADPAANRFVDQLLAVLNPILRNVAGDLRGPVAAATVVGWRGLPLAESMATPAVGQVPKWNGAAWEPGTAGSSGAVTSVGAAAPLTSSGGTTPSIGISGSPAGGVAYATGSTLAYTTAGTAGLPLLSGGAGAPSFGALNLATAGTVAGLLPIAYGGTNSSSSPTAGAVAYGTGSAFAWSLAGSAGEILFSGGGSAPYWGPLPASGVSSVTASSPLSSSGGTTPNVSLTGTVDAAHGGTGLSSYVAGDLLTATAATTLARLPLGASGTFLSSDGTSPAWAVPTASTTGAGVGGYRSTVTTPETVALTDYVLDVTTSGAFTVNLPTAGSSAGQAANGRVFVIKNSGGAVVTVAPAGAQLIDGASSFTIVTQYAAFLFISTGSGWALI